MGPEASQQGRLSDSAKSLGDDVKQGRVLSPNGAQPGACWLGVSVQQSVARKTRQAGRRTWLFLRRREIDRAGPAGILDASLSPSISQAKLPAILGRGLHGSVPPSQGESENVLEPARTLGPGVGAHRNLPESRPLGGLPWTMSEVVLGKIELGKKVLTLLFGWQARVARGRSYTGSALAGWFGVLLSECENVVQMIKFLLARGRGWGRNSRTYAGMSSVALYTERLPIITAARWTTSGSRQRLTSQGRAHRRGREKVIAWLKKLENDSARRGSDDHMSSYDFTWMWAGLGLSNGR